MRLDKEKVENLINKARKRQHDAYMNYQDTGNGRYYTTCEKNEALADALEGYLKSEEYIRAARRLSSLIRGWDAEIQNLIYCKQAVKEEKINKILSEIQAEAQALKIIRV